MKQFSFHYRLSLPNSLFLLIILQSFISSQATYMNISQGVSLSPTGNLSAISSPSGLFTFGFRAVQYSSPTKYLLAIWYNTPSSQPIIWYAKNGINPAFALAGSTLSFNNTGRLYLTDSTGNNILWNSTVQGTSHGSLLDTGNFVLYISAATDVPTWQSFDNPTDTLVPGQILPIGSFLWSKLYDTDFSTGTFTMIPQSIGRLKIYHMNPITGERLYPHWHYPYPNNGTQLVFNSSGALYYLLTNDTGLKVISAPTYNSTDYYQHATLDPDGDFRLYTYQRKSANATWMLAGQLSGDSSPPQSPSCTIQQKNKDFRKLVIISSVLFICSLAILIIGVWLILFYFHSKTKLTKPLINVSSLDHDLYTYSNMRAFAYRDLEHATNNFSEELGRGAFGIVYKGLLETEPIIHLAVKKLDRLLKKGDKEFESEIQSIGKTHHRNLVKLLGFCKEGPNRMLVYEYMSMGSLAGFLFEQVPKPTWCQRKQIAIGIARGLSYLHEDCCTQIMHCDIKPENILLDDNLLPKISDFGLAKLLWPNQTRTYTEIRGTKGYVAPEWFKNTPVTAKIDVFSFGVLLLEIVCCRKNIETDTTGLEKQSDVLTYWAHDCLRDSTVMLLVERDLEAVANINQVEEFVKVAIWCIQEEPSARPSMHKVVSMLEGVAPVPDPPLDAASFSGTFLKL